MRNNFTKITLTAIVAGFALSTAFAANLPKNCTDEIVALSKGSGFDMQRFASDLPPAVAKAKLQAKAPFGKPKDSEKTSVGMTFGCLKAFPESPGEIQSLLKDVSQEIAKETVKDAVASQLGTGVQETPQALAQPEQAQQQYLPSLPQPEQQPNYPPQQAQPQYQYPPPQPPPAQPQYFYYPPPQQAQPECNCNCGSQADNFTAGERWGTWALNMFIPGLGSAAIMDDYAGMGIQLALTALGVISIAALGWEEFSYGSNGGRYCADYDMYGDCRYYNYYNDTYYGTRETPFVYVGSVLLGVNFIFNIARSNSYNKPANEFRGYSSNGYSRFNLAILPNKRGEAMPYLMYNKTF
jgi:hypothetical protein